MLQAQQQAQARQQMLSRRLNTLESKKQNLISNLRQNAQVRHARSNSHENVAMSQAQEMMMRHSINEPGHTNIDPFLAGKNIILVFSKVRHSL